MSDPTVTTAAEPSIALDPATSKPPAATPNAAPAPAPEEKPAWLDARLDRARAQALKDAGFDSEEDAKQAAAERKAEREAKKTVAQKNAELEASLKTTTEALGTYAKGQLASLTDAQRNAVAAVAGDDPAKQLLTIEALRPTWASAAAPAATVKDTAPVVAGPKDAGSQISPPDNKAAHAEMHTTNPVVAARFAIENRLFEIK